jgi:hypothetical protein
MRKIDHVLPRFAAAFNRAVLQFYKAKSNRDEIRTQSTAEIGCGASKLVSWESDGMASSDIVAITGIAVTFAVSVANLIYSLRTNRRTIFVNTVTTSRLKWIESLRDKVSEFIAVTTRLSEAAAPSEDRGALLVQRDTLEHQIALHLNPIDAEDLKIRTLVDHVRELTGRQGASGDLSVALILLRDATGNYLKKEWNRVKRESTGKPS